MIRPTRLGAAATIAALGVSMASPAVDGAAASSPALPDSSQLTAALDQLGLSSTASSLLNEIQTLQTSGLSTTTLSPLDNTLGPVLNDLTELLATLLGGNGQIASALQSTINSVTGLLPSGATGAEQQALSELQSVLTTAGLGSLLSSVNSTNGAGALTQLAALSSLAPGASTATGGLSSLGALLTNIATTSGVPSNVASALTTLAGQLTSSSSLSPTQLEGLISSLQGISSNAPVGSAGATVTQLLTSITSQLAQSGSLLGGLASVGSSLSSLTDSSAITSALSQLSSLSSLAPNSSGSLPELGSVLSAIAATPGVSTTDAGTLNALASKLSATSGISAPDLLSGITSLQGLTASLPAPLNSLVSSLTTALSGSGSILGTLPGLTSADQGNVLSELTTLSGLSQGAAVPALPGIAAVLDQLADTSPFAGTSAASILQNIANGIKSETLTGSTVSALGAVLNQLAGSLPSPLNTTISGLASALTSDATTIVGTVTGQTGTSGSTGSTGSTGTTASTGSTGTVTKTGTTTSTKTGTTSATTALAKGYDWGLLKKESRTVHSIKVTLFCFAASGATCTDRLHATESGFKAVTKTVRFRSGKTDSWTLNLKPLTKKAKKITRKSKAPAIKLSVSSLNYKTSKTVKG